MISILHGILGVFYNLHKIMTPIFRKILFSYCITSVDIIAESLLFSKSLLVLTPEFRRSCVHDVYHVKN